MSRRRFACGAKATVVLIIYERYSNLFGLCKRQDQECIYNKVAESFSSRLQLCGVILALLGNDKGKREKCASTPDQQFKWNRCIVTVDTVALRALFFGSALRPPSINPRE